VAHALGGHDRAHAGGRTQQPVRIDEKIGRRDRQACERAQVRDRASGNRDKARRPDAATRLGDATRAKLG